MKIKKIKFRHRRDFRAIFQCEHCGHTEEKYGYDDRNFHHNVIPNMECPKCGKKAPKNHIPRATKYPENKVV